MRWRPNVSSIAPKQSMRSPGSPADTLDTIAKFFQFGLDPIPMLALHLDRAIANRSPGAAELLERLGKL